MFGKFGFIGRDPLLVPGFIATPFGMTPVAGIGGHALGVTLIHIQAYLGFNDFQEARRCFGHRGIVLCPHAPGCNIVAVGASTGALKNGIIAVPGVLHGHLRAGKSLFF